ncbi:MAG: hypothetical protein AAF710_11355 [Planctomycetota bacterium]
MGYGTVGELPAFDNNAHAVFSTRRGGSAVITPRWSSRIGVNLCGVIGETGTAFLSGTAPGNNGSWCSHELHLKADGDAYETVEMLHDNLDDTPHVREAEDFVSAILD